MISWFLPHWQWNAHTRMCVCASYEIYQKEKERNDLKTMRKIVTTKDFEFSPRKWSRGSQPLQHPSACACIMHSQRRYEKNVLAAAAKLEVGVAPSLQFLCIFDVSRAASTIRLKCLQVCIIVCADTRGTRCAQLCCWPLVALITFFNNDTVSSHKHPLELVYIRN